MAAALVREIEWLKLILQRSKLGASLSPSKNSPIRRVGRRGAGSFISKNEGRLLHTDGLLTRATSRGGGRSCGALIPAERLFPLFVIVPVWAIAVITRRRGRRRIII